MRLRGLANGFGPWCDIWSRSGGRVQRHADDGRARVVPPAGAPPIAGDEDQCIAMAARLAPPSRRKRAAVLLHGILNHPGIMAPLAEALSDAGWAVANIAYPSTRLPITEHARAASAAARALAEDGACEVDFIGHSMGGLVARAALARACCDGWQPGGLVLVGSPAHGSAMASLLRHLPGYGSLLGEGGYSVTRQGAAEIPLPQCTRVAIIAGGNGARGFNPLLNGDNDATVTVAETQMPEIDAAFLLVRATHNALAADRATAAATLSFLQTGRVGA